MYAVHALSQRCKLHRKRHLSSWEKRKKLEASFGEVGVRNVVQDAAAVRILGGLCLAGLEDSESLVGGCLATVPKESYAFATALHDSWRR